MNKAIKWFRFYGGTHSNDTWEYNKCLSPESIKQIDFEESEYIRIIFEDGKYIDIK